MSKNSLIAKLEFMCEMIENIDKIVQRHGGVVKALEDFEGEMAIMMAIAQIGETLKKLDDAIVDRYDLVQDKEGAYYTRNYIVHDYEGVDKAFIENIIRVYLPELKAKFEKIKQDFEEKE